MKSPRFRFCEELYLFCLATIVVTAQCQMYYYGGAGKTCGVLYSERNFTGLNFTLGDNDHSMNLADDFRSSQTGWNSTASFNVASGCQLSMCNETYFDGVCANFTQGSHPNPSLAEVASVKCACARECKCSDIRMKKSDCARAYVYEGCSTCNAMYTDLSDSEPAFPDDFAKSVRAFVLRKGCWLTLFSERDYKGEDMLIEDEVFDGFQGEVGSYKCECDDNEWVPRAKPPRPPNYPPLVDIPYSLDDVMKMLQGQHSEHPGVKAAFRSLNSNPEKRRSSKNAYILLLGTTGAGKSSTANILFDNPNVTRVGGGKSTTSDIHEFRIPVPIDELGIRNSELRVVDTPGLGDTRGLDQDAKFLATLDDYLSSHEELKERIPNVVLIFHHFHDNRFDGVGSRFVRMLRGLDHFRSRITDDNYSNVIFVFSHFCSVTKETKRKPEQRLLEFKKVIESYSLFPKPLILTVAENKAAEQDLLRVNGYVKLPNNEYYPRNLFEKLDLVTANNGDAIGQAVFRSAFRDSEDFNISRVDFELVSNAGPKVTHYLDVLKNVIFNINKTEISELLAHAHDTMDTRLKKDYPHTLHYLQKALNLREINSKEDIPKTTTEILKLLTTLEQNEATLFLLEKALKIKAPPFPHDTAAGHGYNVFKDMVLHSSPFNMGELQHSDIGFMLPQALSCRLAYGTAENFLLVNTRSDYIQRRLKDLGIVGTISEESFSNTTRIKTGYNIKEIAFREDGCTITASREVKQFEVELNDGFQLTEEFKDTVKGLGEYNETDSANVNRWQAFFDDYGTHIVKSAYGGGAVTIELSSNESFNEDLAGALFDLVRFEGDVSVMLPTAGNRSSVLKAGVAHELRFLGGDQQYHTRDLTKLSIENAAKIMSNWKKSLKFSPVILSSGMRLIPMSQVVKDKMGKAGRKLSAEIERVAELRFKSKLKVKPVTSSSSGSLPVLGGSGENGAAPPPTRQETPYVAEMIKMMQDSNDQMRTLMLEMKRIGETNQQRNLELQEERERNRREEAQRNREFQLEVIRMQSESAAKREQWERENAVARQTAAEERDRRERERQDLIQRQREASDRRMQELMITIANRPVPSGGGDSCLKEGTPILMADWSWKSVESLSIGDFVMDSSLTPTKVLGVSYEFLMHQKFYGFDNNSYFFTNSHIFAGPKANNGVEGIALYAKSPPALFSLNPLMEYLNITELASAGESTVLFHLQNNEMTNTPVHVFEDPQSYSEDSKIYFIQVDNELGTYIANGYVCRHEIPPVEMWPNTMSMLFRVVQSSAFDKVAEIPYKIEHIPLFNSIVEQVASKVASELQNELALMHDGQTHEEGRYALMTLDQQLIDDCIGTVFSNPTQSALGVGIYAKVGKLIASYLDEPQSSLNAEDTARLQYVLFDAINQQLEVSLTQLH